jgi:hypothetical protein
MFFPMGFDLLHPLTPRNLVDYVIFPKFVHCPQQMLLYIVDFAGAFHAKPSAADSKWVVILIIED